LYIEEIMHVEESCFIPEIQEEKEVFLSRIETGLFFIFRDTAAGKIAGYISAEYMENIPESSRDIALNHKPCGKSAGIIYISSFALLPEYQGTGLGKEMWDRCCERFSELSGVNKLVLLVNEEWKGAFHIYEKSGFEKNKVFEGFFPGVEGKKTDGIFMVKRL